MIIPKNIEILLKKYVQLYGGFARKIVNILFLIVSVTVVMDMLYWIGVDRIDSDTYVSRGIFKFVFYSHIVLIFLRITLNRLSEIREVRFVPKLLYWAIYTVFIGKILENIIIRYPHIFAVLSNNYFLITVMILTSVLEISRAAVEIVGRKTNPTRIFILSFVFTIVVGSFCLMLPLCRNIEISYIDALFVSTSAVCVTGLTPLDISTAFTPLGHIFILFLIQIGGLGFMTFTSFFSLFFLGNASFYNQMTVGDIVSSKSLSALLITLKYIIIVTFSIELLGALFIFLNIRGSLGLSLPDELFFSVFHSISAFCNAGFSTMSANLGEVTTIYNNGFILTISFLIIFGGLGFPIFANLIQTVFSFFKALYYNHFLKRPKYIKIKHKYNLNTRLAVITTILLLVFGTIIIAIFEWNNAFAQLSFSQKLTQSFFSSVTPRTAGFNTLSYTSFSTLTIIITIMLMWIGGGSQSTAGGIKTNAFAISVINLYSMIRGKKETEIFNRRISSFSVNNAYSTIFLYLLFAFVAQIVLMLIEPEIAPLYLLFEIVSAMSTVGLSMNVTPILGEASKIIIIVLMFVGRIGVLVFMRGIVNQYKRSGYSYPNDDVIIN